MIPYHLRILVIGAMSALLARESHAQALPDTLRGTVASDSGAAIAGAQVVITRAPDRLSLFDTTDASGHFQIIFNEGTGDYLVHASALGRVSARKRVRRAAAERSFSVDFKLESGAQKLAAVTVSTTIPKPTRRPDYEVEPGESGKFTDGVNATLLPDQAGKLAAISLALPGISAAGGGISALGLGPNQNSTTLNGMAFSGAAVPRDIFTRVKTSTSTYDPSRGWFSGVQTNVEMTSGTGFSYESISLDGDMPALQYVDRTAAQNGQRFGRISVGGAASGMVAADRFAYNGGVQATRRVSDATALETSGTDLFRNAGLSADSAERFLSLASVAGVPLRPAGISPTDVIEELSFIGRLDHKPYDFNSFKEAKQSWHLIGQASLSKNSALGWSPIGEIGHGGRSSDGTLGVGAGFSSFWKKNYLSSLESSLSVRRTRSDPYLGVPEGSVLVSSQLPDGTSAISQLLFGGNSSLASDTRRWIWETTAETQFYVPRHTGHRLKLNADSRVDRFSDDRSANRFGTFTYNSLADFAANQPASFTRTLASPIAEGSEWNGFLSAADFWKVKPSFSLLYGARLEGNRFLTAPPFNPEIAKLFSVRSDNVPSSAHLSPRAGFTWVRHQAGSGFMFSQLGQFNIGTISYIRGGIGEFRSFLDPNILSGPLTLTGLPGGALSMACFGAAVPVADWNALAMGAAPPGECAGGATGVLTDSAPRVQLFDRSYRAPRSWRGNLSYASNYKKLNYSLEGTYSLNLDQPGTTDLNFGGVQQFVLDGEGRPVFVPPSSVVEATGLVSPVASRKSQEFSSVVNFGSALRSVSRQLTFSASPDLQNSDFALRFAYVLSSSRAWRSGFDAPTFGSPLERSWARGDFDARHQFTISGGYVLKGVGITFFSKMQSGFPFTPMVSSDVNGDGRANDRAFIFSPSSLNDATLASATTQLLRSSSGKVRSCLNGQLGRAAGVNSCEGPWTATLNIQATLDKTLHGGRFGNFAISFANALGGLDQLLHGSAHLQGWGLSPFADPVLYNVRGFDAARNSFRYEVNPRFGNTSPRYSTLRAPFRVTLSASFNLSAPTNLQVMNRFLRPGRAGLPGTKLTAAELLIRYRRNVSDPYAELIRERDSLLLTPDQENALQNADEAYQQKEDSVWVPLTDYLAGLPDKFNVAEALKRQEAATDSAWEVARQDVKRTLPGILSPVQLSILPGYAGMLYKAKKPVHIRQYFMI